ncbi:sugar phosphate isomerase/epimerase [bacterium]|nr:sugar phosphate isomerase/epimerase [bacterium]
MSDIKSNLSASVYVFFPHDDPNSDCMPVADCAKAIVDDGLGVEVFLSEYNYKPYTQQAIEQIREIGKKAKFLTCHTNQFEWDYDKLMAEIPMVASFSGSVLVVHSATFGLEHCDNPPSPQTLRDICKFAADSGIMLAFENSGRTGIAMMRHALDVIGSVPGLGICIDTGHANRSKALDGVPVEDYLREFCDLIIELHINDNLGKEDLHLPPGEGNIDWNAVMTELRALPQDTFMCIELANHGDDAISLIHQSCDFLTRS